MIELRRLVSVARKVALNSPISLPPAIGDGFCGRLEPEFLWLEATGECPSRCSFCDIWRRPPARDLLSPREIVGTLQDPLFRALKVVVISGGEPTLRNDLEAIIAGVHEAVPRARFVLSSSAMLPERLLRVTSAALARSIPIEVGVSLDGLGSEHDRIRGMRGLFQKVDYSLRELVKLRRRYGRRLRITVGFVLSDATVDQLS